MQHGGGDVSTLTEKEEAYARARAEGKGPSAAYRACTDTTRMTAASVAANAKRFERKPAIKARIDELRRRESSQESSSNFGASNGLKSQENPEGHGGEDDTPAQGPRIGHLDSLGGVVREMGAVYREARTGKTEPDVACKLVYILKEIRAALEAHVLERLELRLEAIEAGRLGDGEHRRGIPPPQTH
jgi:hypothetical protein